MSADCSKFHTAYRCKCDGRWVLTTCTGDNSEDGCEALRATLSHLDNRVDALRTSAHLRNGARWSVGHTLLCIVDGQQPSLKNMHMTTYMIECW
jgi:hypothetical protein